MSGKQLHRDLTLKREKVLKAIGENFLEPNMKHRMHQDSNHAGSSRVSNLMVSRATLLASETEEDTVL
jgi:hypothetical protein